MALALCVPGHGVFLALTVRALVVWDQGATVTTSFNCNYLLCVVAHLMFTVTVSIPSILVFFMDSITR